MWITFVWNCFTCSSNMKIGSVTSSFDIVQFSRSCSASANRLTTWLFYHRSDFLSSSFFRSFWTFWTWTASGFSVLTGTFQRLLVLFFCFLAGTSEVILLSQRLALKYNTIPPPRCQHFFTSFFKKLQNGCVRAEKTNPSDAATAASAPLFQGELAVLSRVLYYYNTL